MNAIILFSISKTHKIKLKIRILYKIKSMIKLNNKTNAKVYFFKQMNKIK